jgi:hypothetical protein
MPDAKAIVSCARLYSQGMELIEERADVAYQMFIAALCRAVTRELLWTPEARGVFDAVCGPMDLAEDELYIEIEAALPKEENFSEALHAGEGLAPTAAIGTSPHIPVDAVIAVLSGEDGTSTGDVV